MKSFIIALFFSFNLYAGTYAILDNGITVTLDKDGFVYDFGHFHLPYKIGIKGGNFFTSDNKLFTIDNSGFLYDKNVEIENKVKAFGSNYLITDKGVIYTVAENGYFYLYDKDKNLRNDILAGGNFFIINSRREKALYTVSSEGNYYKIELKDLDLSKVKKLGSNYFQLDNNTIYTVSHEGLVFKKDIKVNEIKIQGGTFFVDSEKTLYTVTSQGFLIMPLLPNDKFETTKIAKTGHNYFIYDSSDFYSLDSLGAVYKREIKGSDFRKISVFSK